MTYKVVGSKEESFSQIKSLVNSFKNEYVIYKKSSYKEAQLRIDFINPFLKSLGWDVDNQKNKSQFLRDVIQEETIDVEEENVYYKKNPDYTLRIEGNRKMFVEAKKVSVDILKDKKASFQTRRYGWNSNLGISVLTNFEYFIIYDCRFKPYPEDGSNVSRYKIFYYENYLENFDELYELLSFDSISKGYLDNYFAIKTNETTTFDNDFLKQIEFWRVCLANDIVKNNVDINNEEINILIQRLLNRIVFLRICEDRDIEKFETLKKINNYDELKELFNKSDKKYNSGLFDFIEDNFSLKIKLNSEILIQIFNELYYPQSSYNFSIIDPNILSQIYEKYLGSKVFIDNDKNISIIEEPEVAASNGVVPTPKFIVKNIVNQTLSPITANKNFDELLNLKIADICSGSGTFLLSAFDFLVEKYTEVLSNEKVLNNTLINETNDGNFYLTLYAKHKIIINNLYGVDINPYAVEVCKFSLLLKILEDENEGSINNFLDKYNKKILPRLENNIKNGNSLIDDNYFIINPDVLDDNDLLYKIKPFNFFKEFDFLNSMKGFDAIIGNPPYVRIQNIVKFSKEEINYFKNKKSNYSSASTEAFDKYYLFIQRAINLINEFGKVGYIVPHKFFVTKGGESLRDYIYNNASIYRIFHFGVKQIFPNRSTYTAIIILDKKHREKFDFKKINNLYTDLTIGNLNFDSYNNIDYNKNPWVFVSNDTRNIFNKIKKIDSVPLHSISEISVGLQTSDDEIYIFKPISESVSTYTLEIDGSKYEIEKEICKSCILDLSFELFDHIDSNSKMIFPYDIVDGKATVYEPEFLENNYPLAWEYFNVYKDRLSKRSISGGKEPKWYQFGRSQSLSKFLGRPKLIWSVISTDSPYTYDNNNLLFTGGGNGPYYSLLSKSDYSLYYILGILSHPIIEMMVKSKSSEFRGAYYSHGKQFIKDLPIKVIDFDNQNEFSSYNKIIDLVQKLLQTKRDIKKESINTKRDILKRKIQTLKELLIDEINILYNFSKEDIQLVMKDELLNSGINV